MTPQAKWMQEQKKKGLCVLCARPAYLDGVLCRKHMTGNGSTIRRRKKWAAVDWTKPPSVIAKELGVSPGAVFLHKRSRGIKTRTIITRKIVVLP